MEEAQTKNGVDNVDVNLSLVRTEERTNRLSSAYGV